MAKTRECMYSVRGPRGAALPVAYNCVVGSARRALSTAWLFSGFAVTTWAQTRFDPSFRNDVRAALPDDAEIVRVLRSQPEKRLANARVSLVHGHFLDNGGDNAVVTGMEEFPGESPVPFLFSKAAGEWVARPLDRSINATYCQVIPVTSRKDILLCQTNYEGWKGASKSAETDTNLYTLDFTQEQPQSSIFQLTDTTGSGLPSVTSANIRSLEFRDGFLKVRLAFGRNEAPREYNLDFTLGAKGFAPTESSQADFDAVTRQPASEAAQLVLLIIDPTRTPIPGVEVRVFAEGDNKPIVSGISGEDGTIMFSALRPRVCYICGHKEGYSAACVGSLAITPGTNKVSMWLPFAKAPAGIGVRPVLPKRQ